MNMSMKTARLSARGNILFGIAVLVLLLGTIQSDGAFVSSEVRFADDSAQGLSIVPASCPSSPHETPSECDEPGFNECFLSDTPPGIIAEGTTATLHWDAGKTDFTYLSGSISQGVGAVSSVGSIPVTPAQTTQYVYTGTRQHYQSRTGQVLSFSCSTTVAVDSPPIDYCPNIAGTQTSVPSGYHTEDGQCVPDPQKYSCNTNNQCIADSSGPYTSSSCDNACGSVVPKYSCNASNQCVADSSGSYTSSSCDNACGGGSNSCEMYFEPASIPPDGSSTLYWTADHPGTMYPSGATWQVPAVGSGISGDLESYQLVDNVNGESCTAELTIQCPAGQTWDGTQCVGQKYSCNTNNQCIADPSGPYTTSSCGGACAPVQKYSCNTNNQCALDSNGPYTSSNCNNICGSGGGFSCNAGNQCVASPSGSYATSNCNNACGGGSCSKSPYCDDDTNAHYSVSASCQYVSDGDCDGGGSCTKKPYCDAGTNKQYGVSASCQYVAGGSCIECPGNQSKIWNPTTHQFECRVTGCPLPVYYCQADNLCHRTYGSSPECQPNNSCSACAYGCTQSGSSSSCNPPPAPEIVTWNVHPTLVHRESTVQVEWEAKNVRSCTVRGTNSDGTGNNATGVWGGTAGSTHNLSGTKTSSPITAQTIYTIVCQPVPESVSSPVSRSTTVNIIPIFQEQ